MKDFPTDPRAEDLEATYRRLLGEVPWTAEIYLPTSRISPANKVAGMRRVSQIHNQRLETHYRPRLRSLRDRYAGAQRCFIIGNGPSLNRTDLTQLAGEVTFSTNAFFLKMPELGWAPTFHVVEDHLVAEDRATELNALKGPTKIYPSYLGYCLDEAEDTIFLNHRARKSYPDGFDFSTDASQVTYTGCTVTFTCMQLAHYLGFEEIYLIGVDASYDIPKDVKESSDYGTGVLDMESDDPNHFHPDYFGKGFRWHDPQVEQMIAAYEEARRATDASGRPIFNATVGGQLEVFQRRSFQSLFPHAIPPEAFDFLDTLAPERAEEQYARMRHESEIRRSETHLSTYPRLLVVDMTGVGGVTATGWPEDRLMTVTSEGTNDLTMQGGPIPDHLAPVTGEEVVDLVDFAVKYDPDLILYRPLPEKPKLHEFMELVFAKTLAPTVTSIMDDWLPRIKAEDEVVGRFWERELLSLTSRSALNMVISEPMARAYRERFGVDFQPFANAVAPEDWPPPPPRLPGPIRVRYAGGLAPDMTLDSVRNTAEAVEALSAEIDIVFEIHTREHWLNSYAAEFASFSSTQLSCEELDVEDYRHWLQQADILLLAYNFDERSTRYVRLSMANKLPELLASGRPVLAIGPRGLATLDWMDERELGIRVSEPGFGAILDALRPVARDPVERADMAARARSRVFEEKNLHAERASFQSRLREAARQRVSPQGNYDPDGIVSSLPSLIEPEAPVASQPESAPSNPAQSGAQVQPLSAEPVAPQGGLSRIRRIIAFYLSWRGIFPLLSIAGFALPLRNWRFSDPWLNQVEMWSMPLAIGFVFFFLGYLYTLVLDHHELNEQRMRRINHRLNRRK
jgi:glycosyltransferase involved in cell wall biosynthesis